jgi:hypothetical protein
VLTPPDLQSRTMAPKKKPPTFRQQALMISNRGELSTQAMEDIKRARAATQLQPSGGTNSTSTSAPSRSSSAVAGGILMTALSAPEDVQLESDNVEQIEGGATITTPTTLVKKIRRR